MRKSKKVAAFLMALAVVSMNVPLMYSGINNSVAYAEEETQEIFQFTKQPQSQTASIGKTIEFTVEVSGTQNIAYQWQYSSNNGKTWNNSTTGYPKTATLSVEATEKRNGNMYRCIVSDGTTILTSESATLTVGEEFAIKKQPQSQTASVGKIVEFSVGVSEGYNTSYQWKYYSPSTKVWKNCTLGNPNTATLSVEATDSRNGYKYKCVVTDGTTTLTSEIATLTIGEEFAINKQPQSQTVSVGAAAIFSVDVTGSDNIAYQWQYSSNNGKTWNNSTSGNPTTNTLSVEATNKRSGNRYRCIVSNGSTILTSTPALLTVTDKEEFKITESPEDVTAILNTDITFHIATNVGNATYQWQWRNSANGTWANSSTGNPTTDTLTVNATLRRNGYQYRCVVSDGTTTLESDPVTLIVREKEEFKITESPVNLIAVSNTDITFHIVTNDENATYQWQWRTGVNGTWKSSTTGNPTTDRLTVKAESKRNGYQYRCIVSDGITTLTSNPATLTIASPITLTDPSNLTITPSDSATFTVTATGTGDLTYAWESSTDGTTWSAISGANVATLTVSGSDAVDGTQYRCMVSDNYGQSVTSNAATLTVRNPITLSELVDTTAVEDKNVTFSINAEGADNLTYQWQTAVAPKDENTPIDWTDITSATSSTYTFKAKYNLNGRLYRCLVSTSTETVNSSVATLTVTPAYTVLSNTTKEISMNLGDACQLDATGTGLRYYSNTTALTVDKNGVVTANDTCTGYVFVLDRYGHKMFYKIHVVEAFEELAFDEPVISVLPGESIRLYTNKDAYQMVSDEDKSSVYYNYYWSCSEYSEFTGYVPGTYTVMAYTNDGEVATCDVIVEGEVIDAALNTAYNGLIEVDPEDPDFNEAALANTWYRYVNNTEDDLMVTFDARMIEAAEATLNSPYAIYYKDNFNEPVEYSAEEFETAQIYVDPGKEIYIRPQVNDMTTSVYDFTINATAYNPVAYTIGTDVKNVVLDRKDYTEYTFTPSTPGEYELTASSRTPFYWQLEDVENGYEAIVGGWEASAVLTTFNLEPNHKYAIRFNPLNKAYEGTLSFTIAKSEETIVDGAVNTQYNSDNAAVLKAGKTTYYKFELGDAEINNLLNVYEFTANYEDGLSYVVLDSDLYTEHETYSSSNGYRLYIDEPTTIYVKVSNNSDSAIAPEFILREYDRSLTQIDDVDEGSNEIAAYSVQCYEFTAPENGRYKFDFAASDYSVSVNYEVYFGDEIEYNSEYSAYNDYTGWYDEDGHYNEGYENKLDMSYTLSAGEKVYFKVTGDFNEENEDTIIPYNWSVICEEAYPVTDLALDTPTTGATVDGQKQYFKFTAPNNGVYYFWSQARAQMYGDLYSELDGEWLAADAYSGAEGNFCLRYRLKAGQTVYLSPKQVNDRDVEYQVVVSKTNNSTKWTPTYEHTAMTLGEETTGTYTDYYLFDTFSFTAEETGYYVFTSVSDQNMEGWLFSDAALTEDIAYDDDSAGDSQFEIVTWIEAGETVYLKPTNKSEIEVPEYSVTVSQYAVDATALTVDNVVTGSLDADSYAWYSFTAPAEGTYLFEAMNYDLEGETEANQYAISFGTTDEIVTYDQESITQITKELAEGETVYIRVNAIDEGTTVYKLVVANCDQPYNVNLLSKENFRYIENPDSDVTVTLTDETETGFTVEVSGATPENQTLDMTQILSGDFALIPGNHYKLTFNMSADTYDVTDPYMDLFVALVGDHYPFVNGWSQGLDNRETSFEFYFDGSNAISYLLFDNFRNGTYTFSDIELVRISDFQFALAESQRTEAITDTFNGHTYAVIPYATNPIIAEEICEAYGGHLVTITSQAEQDFVAALAASVDYDRFWLGGSDNGSEGEWYWVNGETWDYTAWNDGEPNNGLSYGDQNYSVMGRGIEYLWDDCYGEYDDYTDMAYFICEWDIDPLNIEDSNDDDDYTVTYNANGGTFENGETVITSSGLTEDYISDNGYYCGNLRDNGWITQPTREGYAFWGWSENPDWTENDAVYDDGSLNSDRCPSGMELNGDIVLYACWVAVDEG